MQWSVLRESGIEYAPFSARDDEAALECPTFAQRADDGTYLVVDELATTKIIPFRFECRTVRVDADRQVLYDTRQHGIDDGYGCLVDQGRLAVLRRTRWELLIVSPRGTVEHRFGLESFSKRTPRLLSWTPAGTLLIAFLDGATQFDLIEIDRHGRLLWYLRPGKVDIGVPASIQQLPSGTLLVADPFRHVAVEFDRQGNILWQFGAAGDPSRKSGHLSNPGSARRLANGETLLADTRNHRIVVTHANGSANPISVVEQRLCDPAYVDRLPDGHHLVCDTGNRRVIETDGDGRICWQFGHSVATRRTLSYPRSVEVTDRGTLLVADTAHDRIVELNGDEVQTRPYQGDVPLFWPRCVRALPQRGLLVADGRNHRVVQIDAVGSVVRELCEVDLAGGSPLADPHDVWLLANDRLLISDSPRNRVMEVDWSGKVHRMIGGDGPVELDDPHSAQQLEDGRIVITDTGHHRVVIVGPDGTLLQEILALSDDSGSVRLNRPRYAEVAQDGTMVIVDTGNNRVLAATPSGELVWELAQIPGSRLSGLSQPRWARLLNRYEVVVCDHYHHRILHMRYAPAKGEP